MIPTLTRALRALALATLLLASAAPASAAPGSAASAPAAPAPTEVAPMEVAPMEVAPVATWGPASPATDAPAAHVGLVSATTGNITIRVRDFNDVVVAGSSFYVSSNASLSPGAAGVYQVTVQNPEAAPLTVVPTFTVLTAEWLPAEQGVEPWASEPTAAPPTPAPAIVVDAEPVVLEPHATRVLTLDVSVPDDAPAGWTFRLAVSGLVEGRPDPVPLAPDLILTLEPPDPPPAVGAMTAKRASLLETLGLALALTGVAASGAYAAVASRRDDLRALALAPLLGLFTRLGRQDVLSHGTRDRLLGLVRDRPGATFSDLRAATGLATGVVTHHLGVLEQHHVLVSRREGRHRRYYPAGARLPDAPSSGMQARVLELLATGRLAQSEVAARLGITQQAVSYHARALARKGLLPAPERG